MSAINHATATPARKRQANSLHRLARTSGWAITWRVIKNTRGRDARLDLLIPGIYVDYITTAL